MLYFVFPHIFPIVNQTYGLSRSSNPPTHILPSLPLSLLFSSALVSNLLSSSACKEQRIQICRYKVHKSISALSAPNGSSPSLQKEEKRPPPHELQKAWKLQNLPHPQTAR